MITGSEDCLVDSSAADYRQVVVVVKASAIPLSTRYNKSLAAGLSLRFLSSIYLAVRSLTTEKDERIAVFCLH